MHQLRFYWAQMYERRTNRRYPAQLDVRIDAEDLGHHQATSLDVSRCGMRLASTQRLVIGAPIEVGFRFGFDDECRRYPATIVRAVPGSDCFELAVEFDEEVPELEPLLQYVL